MLVFDFDQTMFDTSRRHRSSFDSVLEGLGVCDPIPRSFVPLLRGKSDWEVFHILLAIARGTAHVDVAHEMPSLPSMLTELGRRSSGSSTEKQIGLCVSMRRDFLYRSIEADLPAPIPGLDTLLAYMRQKRIVCGIASASPERFVHQVIARSAISDIFPAHLVVGSETIEQEEAEHGYTRGYLAKPHPFSVYLAAQRVQTARRLETGSPIIYIGDSMTDCLLVDMCHDVTGIIINPERQVEFRTRFPALTFIESLEELVGD
ncbi:HAD family hydrolase [Candidatus Kaiserbacteria bacterium]|nr:HAD family hydrolase [Candidatus Kaiserbacteria bacterium]